MRTWFQAYVFEVLQLTCAHYTASAALSYKPVPALCPLPEKHTLDVNQPDSLERDAFGDLAVRNLRFGCFEQVLMKTTEEDLVTPARFLEPYSVG